MHKREKVFGTGRMVPLDRNAKVRVRAFAQAWNARHRQPGQHKGPLTRAFLEVLEALLWGFHNSRSGACFPSYEAIAERAECHRSTVADAIKALELVGILTWQHRITRIRERCSDLFGRPAWRWRVVRSSNAYAFHDPKAAEKAGIPCKSDNPSGTPNQKILITATAPLERALARLGEALATKDGIEQEGRGGERWPYCGN